MLLRAVRKFKCVVCVLLVSSNESLKIFPSGPKLLKAQSVMELLNFDFATGSVTLVLLWMILCVCVCV